MSVGVFVAVRLARVVVDAKSVMSVRLKERVGVGG